MEEDEMQAVPAHVEDVLCSDPDVSFAVAFGSRVAGTHRPSSDLDVAVKFADDCSERERFRTHCSLSSAVQSDDDPFVDLSDLDELPLEHAHRAVQGELLCGDESVFDAVRAQIEQAFEERRDELERHQRDVIRRIAEEGLRG